MFPLRAQHILAHSLSYHTEHYLPIEPHRCSAQSLNRILTAFHHGGTYVGSLFDGQQDLIDSSDVGLSYLLQGAFLCGYARRNLLPHATTHFVKDDVYHNCGGIKKFVRGMVGMKPSDLEHLFVLARTSNEPLFELAIAGSLAEAHVVTTLLCADYTVLESTVDEDVNFSVDLIVPSKDWSIGHVLQIKSDRTLKGVLMSITDRAKMPGLVQNAQRFSRAYEVEYTSVVVQSGTAQGSLFNHQEYDDIANTKQFFKIFSNA